MRQTSNIIERAYQLARSGSCANPTEIERTLFREQFSNVSAHMSSPSLRKELAAICRTTKSDDTAVLVNPTPVTP